MKYRKLGKTDIEVSEISLGCWTLGGDADQGGMGWHGAKEADAIEAVAYGLDHGVNHFDNADVYGMGTAEKMLAKALGSRNKDVVIASKVGWFKGSFEHAYKAENIRIQCEKSLKNLNRNFLDIYYFHNCDFGKDDMYLAEGLAEMRKLQKEGKLRALGLSGYSAADFLRLIPVIKPDCLQSWANIIHPEFIQENMEVAKLLKKEKISFVAFNPLSRGLLTGKFSSKNPPKFDKNDVRAGMDEFKPENMKIFDEKFEKIKEKFGSKSEGLVRVALQYVLSYNAVGCVIPGFRNKAQVEMNIFGADLKLTDEEVGFVTETFR
jgi:myo-inositol catabolism protein IolS